MSELRRRRHSPAPEDESGVEERKGVPEDEAPVQADPPAEDEPEPQPEAPHRAVQVRPGGLPCRLRCLLAEAARPVWAC